MRCSDDCATLSAWEWQHPVDSSRGDDGDHGGDDNAACEDAWLTIEQGLASSSAVASPSEEASPSAASTDDLPDVALADTQPIFDDSLEVPWVAGVPSDEEMDS